MRFKVVLVILLSLLLPQVNASIIDAKHSNHKLVQIAVTNIPSSFSPYALTPLDAQYSHLFFDPLVRWGQTDKIEYRLLAKLKPLKNGKIRFYLKKNIHFHSGNLLTSKDVIWSFNEAQKTKLLKRKLQHIVKIQAVNNSQFDIESKLTPAQLLDYLTHLFILDSAYYKKNKIEHNAVQSALPPPIKTLPLSGTGPYRVESFYAGVNLRVEANTTYWQNQPMLKSLNFVKIKSPSSRLYALTADDIDITATIANQDIDTIEQSANKVIFQTASFNALFLTINEQKSDVFERETARNAVHLAINQAGMLKHILNGTGSIDSCFEVPTELPEEPTYDTNRSKYLLKKIGVPKQLSLLVMVDDIAHTGEVVVALNNMLKKVAIQLVVTEVETIAKWNELQFKHDLTLSAWQSSLMDSENIYQNIFANSLFSEYIQQLFKQQKKKLTMENKIKLFKKYQYTDRIIPLLSQNQIWATHTQFNLEGVFSVNAIPYWHLLTINH